MQASVNSQDVIHEGSLMSVLFGGAIPITLSVPTGRTRKWLTD